MVGKYALLDSLFAGALLAGCWVLVTTPSLGSTQDHAGTWVEHTAWREGQVHRSFGEGIPGSGGCAAEEAELNSPDPEKQDWFGSSVALLGDTAVVGSKGDDVEPFDNAGSALVFVRTGTTWAFQQQLTASDGAFGDSLGESVALSGDTFVVGAELGNDPAGLATGAAYVFLRSGTSWSEQQKLTPSNSHSNAGFGRSAAISGDTIVVGAVHGGGSTNTGLAYVFVRSGTTWSEQQVLAADDGAWGDDFGASVALSGDMALVGANWDDNAAGNDAGSVYVFERNGTTWSQVQKLTASDATALDNFGNSLALDGNTVVIGASFDDSPAGNWVGSAYVFVREGMSWSEQAKLEASDGAASDFFGFSVGLSGDLAVVGARHEDNTAGMDAGSAYVFVREEATWTEQAKLLGNAADDQFGSATAVSGDTAVIAAPGVDFESVLGIGVAYVFRLCSPIVSYCTAGTSASGCQALLSATGTPSATVPSGFTLSSATVEGQKDGLFFFGTNGQQANPWGNGTSYQCVVPPVVRAGTLSGSGTLGLCDGSFSQDLNALWCPTCPKPAKNPGAGAIVQAQLWYRDPLSTSNQTTSLSDAIEFAIGP